MSVDAFKNRFRGFLALLFAICLMMTVTETLRSNGWHIPESRLNTIQFNAFSTDLPIVFTDDRQIRSTDFDDLFVAVHKRISDALAKAVSGFMPVNHSDITHLIDPSVIPIRSPPLRHV